MIANIHHFRREDTGRAIKRREGFIKLSHMSADGRFALHEINMETRIGDLECGLDASDTAADNQGGRMNWNAQRFEFSVVDHARAPRDDGFGLIRCSNLVGVDP